MQRWKGVNPAFVVRVLRNLCGRLAVGQPNSRRIKIPLTRISCRLYISDACLFRCHYRAIDTANKIPTIFHYMNRIDPSNDLTTLQQNQWILFDCCVHRFIEFNLNPSVKRLRKIYRRKIANLLDNYMRLFALSSLALIFLQFLALEPRSPLYILEGYIDKLAEYSASFTWLFSPRRPRRREGGAEDNWDAVMDGVTKRLRIVYKVVARGPFICKRNYRIRLSVVLENEGRNSRAEMGCTYSDDSGMAVVTRVSQGPGSRGTTTTIVSKPSYISFSRHKLRATRTKRKLLRTSCCCTSEANDSKEIKEHSLHENLLSQRNIVADAEYRKRNGECCRKINEILLVERAI